jgi:cytochrome c peroxidase
MGARALSVLFVALGSSAIYSCSSSSDNTVDGVFTPQEWAEVQKLSPLPDVPADPTNQYADNPMAATFGQRLFFEKSFSGPLTTGNDGMNGALGAMGQSGLISCAACHTPDPAKWLVDTRSNPNATSLGADWLPHHAPSLVNACFYQWYHWDGKFDTMWAASVGGIENPKSFNSGRLQLAHAVFNKYKTDYDAIFTSTPLPDLTNTTRFPLAGKPSPPPAMPGVWEAMAPADQDAVNRIMANVGKSFQAYFRQLISRNAPFDQYVAGNHAAISSQAKQGLKLFVGKAACVNCHAGPFLTDNKFHVTGVPQTQNSPHAPPMDTGRFASLASMLTEAFNSNGKYSDDTTSGHNDGLPMMPTMDMTGQFRTKDLRQVAQVGPYMHAGEITTLDDPMTGVVAFYNGGGGTDSTTYSGTKDPLLQPLNLTASEQAAIVAFLQTLTGDPVPANLLMDTSAP